MKIYIICSIGYAPRMFYSYIEVANHSGTAISNVEIQIGADGRNLRCDSLIENRICEERFASALVPGKPSR